MGDEYPLQCCAPRIVDARFQNLDLAKPRFSAPVPCVPATRPFGAVSAYPPKRILAILVKNILTSKRVFYRRPDTPRVSLDAVPPAAARFGPPLREVVEDL
jgi:hypothetical protein